MRRPLVPLFFVLGAGALACGSTRSSPETGSSGTSGANGPSGSSTVASSGASSGANSRTSTSVGSKPPPLPEAKVDILFDIDNSASMGDKQEFLASAIPELIARLVTPECVSASGSPTGTNVDAAGACPPGSSPQFAPVRDMHIGVVTSSLGPRLGVAEGGNGQPINYVCNPTVMVMTQAGTSVSAFNDDEGHLINRTGPFGSGPPVSNATLSEGGGFLSWFPGTGAVTPPTPYTASGLGDGGAVGGTLVGDFTELARGPGESGCGIESQLESWYRFLIQPDPYGSLVLNANQQAGWSGVDTTILQQRHDFLRPDSVVAVVVLTDEDDSEIDVRSYQGSGYSFMSNTFSPPRATSACASNPNSAACASCLGCGEAGAPPAAVCNDANCKVNGGVFSAESDEADWGYNLNLRHVHMPQKYGLHPQFPLTRYSNGLSSPVVPNRVGEYPTPNGSYTGNNNCTNPLFASALPDASAVPDFTAVTPVEVATTLCNLPTGSARTPGDVFFLHIGGVPHQLLQSTPGDGTCPAGTAAADCPQKPALAASDWIKILGQGPASYTAAGGTMSYDYTGIDPHMIESILPRNGASNGVACGGGTCLGALEPAPASNPAVTTLQGPTLVATAPDPVRPDPINGREWTTWSGVHSLPVDRQYACIFQLPLASQRDCAALTGTSVEGNACDCDPGDMAGAESWDVGGPPAPTGNTPDQIPPLCSKTSTDGTTITSAVSDYTVQTYAKAYPTIRELMLANMLGAQGVVSSLCPIHTTDNATGNDPLFGYRPALDALVDRMTGALAPTP